MIAAVVLAVIFGACCLAAAVIEKRRSKRQLMLLEQMLNDAMKGSFTESDYDESMLSKIEADFARYFSSSAISSKAVTKERDKIRSLIADISHQTKTPIANLLLYSELLNESELDDEQRYNANAVHDQAEKLRFLIDSLVKLSRMENGIITLSPEKQSMMPMLTSLYKSAKPKAEAKGIALLLDPTDTEAVFDRKWTEEAIGNIIDNAIKYTPQGNVSISVRPYEMFVSIDISDTGIGIPEQELPKIFGRFYRSTQAGDKEGVGIGLFLAREIVTAENGYIKAASNGKGSVFSVFLPM